MRVRSRASLPRAESLAASQTSSQAAARSTPCSTNSRLNVELQLADDDDRRLARAQGDKVAMADFALNGKAELLEEALDR